MGLTIKQWRVAKELSQEEMAVKCHVHRNIYAGWEQNPEQISVSNAKIIAKALGESVNIIFLMFNLQNVEQLLKGVGTCVITA
ncbi:MAG: helix-turn-helix domain-containing protein [Lachnospiraceae bacterium]|nr:helix-turn-helix domain-containing protein [Lachnospiraceae bacterium]